MGYAYYGVLAVDPEKYSKKDLKPWFDKWKDYFDDVISEDTRTVFIVDWAKGAFELFEEFESIYALRDEDCYLESNTYGYIILGESNDDTEQSGEPWEFNIELNRSIEVY